MFWVNCCVAVKPDLVVSVTLGGFFPPLLVHRAFQTVRVECHLCIFQFIKEFNLIVFSPWPICLMCILLLLLLLLCSKPVLGVALRLGFKIRRHCKLALTVAHEFQLCFSPPSHRESLFFNNGIDLVKTELWQFVKIPFFALLSLNRNLIWFYL